MKYKNFKAFVMLNGHRTIVKTRAENQFDAKRILEAQYGKINIVQNDFEADRAEKQAGSSDSQSSVSDDMEDEEGLYYVFLYLPFIGICLYLNYLLYNFMSGWIHPLFQIIIFIASNIVILIATVKLSEVRLVCAVLYGACGYVAARYFNLDMIWTSGICILSVFIGYYIKEMD